MNNKRTHPRCEVDILITVTDKNNGEVIGNLGNISLGGFMLISNRSLPINRLYQLKISVPQPDGATSVVNIGADSLWAQQLPDKETFWTGFQIIDISDEDAKLIEKLCSGWETSQTG